MISPPAWVSLRHNPAHAECPTQAFGPHERGVLTNIGQAEVEAAPHSHTDTEGPQGAVPQSLPAHHRPVRLVLSRGHLQLVVGPDGRLALAQQGLGTRQGQTRCNELLGSRGPRDLGMNGTGCPGSAGLSANTARVLGKGEES